MAELFDSLVYVSRKNYQNRYVQDNQQVYCWEKTQEKGNLVYYRFHNMRIETVLSSM